MHGTDIPRDEFPLPGQSGLLPHLGVATEPPSHPGPRSDFLVTFSPQTGSFSNSSRSPWESSGINTPLQLNSDGTSESSGRQPSHLLVRASHAGSSPLGSSSRHTPPQNTPQSVEESVEVFESAQVIEHNDSDPLFPGLSDVRPSVEQASFDPVFTHVLLNIGDLGAPDYLNWPGDDEFFNEVFAPVYDCLDDRSVRAQSLANFFDDLLMPAAARSPSPVEYPPEAVFSPSQLVPNFSRKTRPNNPKRKRQRFASEEREKVKQVRRQGACLRCKIYKEKCDLEVPCGKCCEVLATAKIFKQPCEKVSLQEVVAFRSGNSRAGQIRSTFPKMRWSFDDRQIHTIQIRQDFANPKGEILPTMPVTCRRFLPTVSDVLIEPYEAPDGEVLIVTSPPYACFEVDTQKMREVFAKYMELCLPFAENEMFSDIRDDIIQLGVEESRRYARLHKDSPVNIAVNIQACVHIAVKQPIMTELEVLGIKPVDNPKFSIHGKVPVPSVIDYQLDTLMIHYMQGQMKDVTKRLKKLIFARNPTGNWFEIFLTIFILVCTLEQVYVAQMSYLRRSIGLDGETYTNINFVSRHMIGEWKASAKNLIYHFRCVLKAMIPFSLSWTPEKQKQANLDHQSRSYIRRMAEIIEARKVELLKLRTEGLDNPRAQPLLWLLELFIDD